MKTARLKQLQLKMAGILKELDGMAEAEREKLENRSDRYKEGEKAERDEANIEALDEAFELATDLDTKIDQLIEGEV